MHKVHAAVHSPMFVIFLCSESAPVGKGGGSPPPCDMGENPPCGKGGESPTLWQRGADPLTLVCQRERFHSLLQKAEEGPPP